MTSKSNSSLSKDLSLMLNDSDDYNVIIYVGKNPNIKEFRAHTNILRARSPYFKGALSNLWIRNRNNDNMIEFKKPNINPDVFEIILEYIYTGEVNLTKKSGENILALLIASDELLLDELFELVQDYLIKRSIWVEQNFVLVLHTIYKLSRCKKLQDHCIESICADPQLFFTSKDFLSLDKGILYYLLKRDDLAIEEIILWDYLIDWGIMRNPSLRHRKNRKTKWSNINFETLKETLSRFIPLIRFSGISSADFFDRVRPFKPIIPNYIYEEIMEYHMKNALPKTTFLPPRTGNIQKIESFIIKQKQLNIIINWIDKKNSDYNRNKVDGFYNFDLIYRKSRDKNDEIRDRFADKGPVLILIKELSGKIFGGYNPIGWCKNIRNKYLSTKESFIFSFENNEDTKEMEIEIGRVINSLYAIYDYSRTAVNFGKGDLKLKYDKLTSFDGGVYGHLKKNNNRDEYEVEEIEAFSVNITL
ncbi:BTB-domain-containing protein [Rhizophagus irregularis]|uniref:BTB-domain-containing protein n=1 Tax=Rhizophagus irregularis TaxID=588596 RepID=A0A2I1HNP5_9GLOM|nr:BTB-domain-containing protein [Rhizophagus irregularis]